MWSIRTIRTIKISFVDGTHKGITMPTPVGEFSPGAWVKNANFSRP
ncbi:MAG: hypothetical protein KAT27_04845 [Desulfobacterales bacterium]|nr:hypothetical protein [Desulfobacterales bacterium]